MAKRKVKAKAAPAPKPTSKFAPWSKAASRRTTVDGIHSSDSTDDSNVSDVVQPQNNVTPQTTFLTDLPLELLFMIFDYAVPGDHPLHQDLGYPLMLEKQIGLRRVLVTRQPPLLFTCQSLRLALVPYFYSSACFYAMINMRLKGSKSVGDVLTLRRFQVRLPCKLSTIKLTIKLHDLVRRGHNWSAFTEIGLILYEEYQTEIRKSERMIEPVSPRWQLECIDFVFHYRTSGAARLNEDLQVLLSGIHHQAFKSALDHTTNSQAFNTQLEKWFKEDHDPEDPTYRIRKTLKRCMQTSGYQIVRNLRAVYAGL